MKGSGQKAALTRRLLKAGAVVVTVDASVGGVVLPQRLLARGDAVLSFAKGDPADLRIGKSGITATLTFSRRAAWSRRLGRRRVRLMPCVLPWDAVTSIKARAWPEEPPKPKSTGPWTPPPSRDFSGTWHWDDVHDSLDAVVASLREDDRFAARLDYHETRSHHDSTLVYRWGVELGIRWNLDEPWRYGAALTNSQAIYRPCLATREGRVRGATEDERLILEGMADRARILRGELTSDEVAR